MSGIHIRDMWSNRQTRRCLSPKHGFYTNTSSGIEASKRGVHNQQCLVISGWWFQTFFIFHNICDNPSHWLSYFSRWLKPPTRYVCLDMSPRSDVALSKDGGFPWGYIFFLGFWNGQKGGCGYLVFRPKSVGHTIWLSNIAMENGPFIDDLPIKNGDFPWLC